MNRSDPPSFLKVAQRPQNAYEDLEGQKIELDALTPQSMIYVHKCKNSELTLEKKAMKVVVDGCNDCVFSIKSTPMTGMVEFVNCENIVLNIIGEVMIWTLTVDGSRNFKVNAENDNQFESIYIHHCPDFVVSVGKDNPTVVPINMDEPDRQYIIHYEIQGETKKLVAEKVIRDGIYPTTEKEKEFSEKMATMMVDSIIYY